MTTLGSTAGSLQLSRPCQAKLVGQRKTSNAKANAKTDSELKSEEASKDIKRITDMTYEERMEESGTGFGKKKPSLFGGNFSV